MAIELITKIWCDGHLAADAGNVEAETIQVLHANGRVYEVDLCDDCQKQVPWKQMMDVAEVFGRIQESTKPRKSRASLGEPTEECLFCDYKSPSAQGAKMHMRRSHAEEYAKYLGEGDPGDIVVVETSTSYQCEDCDRTFSTQSGLNGHRNSHRVKQSA